MRKLLLALSFIVIFGGATNNTAQATSSDPPASMMCPGIVKGISFYRNATWAWQEKMGVPKTKTDYAERTAKSCNWLRVLAERWRERARQARVEYLQWIKQWEKADRSVYTAISASSRIFGNASLMTTIVGREGGNISSRKLAVTLCNPYAYGVAGGGGLGWNNSGSYAFGPFQFMLSRKPACFNSSAWGTFGSFDDAAFASARASGTPVPMKFKHPASNVGQAVVAGYMLASGGLSHWCASMC